ncbi:EG2771 protein [Tanacetum coccineum]
MATTISAAAVSTLFKPTHQNLNTKITISSLPIKPQFSFSLRPISYKRLSSLNKIRSSATDEEIATVTEDVQTVSDQGEVEPTVTIPVSPSDILTMFFQAEGTMSEAAIPSITSSLQETDGISDLRVQVLEGIASVELKKKTTVQATGVASNLVEIIQSSGFKLQALNLSFEDEDAN